MEIFLNPSREEWADLCLRACADDDARVRSVVADILEKVRKNGEQAIRDITLSVDGVCPESFKVTEKEFNEAEAKVSEELKQAIDTAYQNIYAFHKAQLPREIKVTTMPGVECIQRPVPISSVGLYIPGGTAPLFSTVLMLAIPAKVALCPKVTLCTPCSKSGEVAPAVLYAARRCGVDNVFKIGGAQAIAAMSYGVAGVPKADKIFGPGNRYVTAAKQMVSTRGTAIDMPAGPSEVMVLCDKNADVRFVAADLLSQAEHGRDSQAIAVCTSEPQAKEILSETLRQLDLLPRKEMAAASLEHSRIIVLPSEEQMVEFANEYASEHLIINMADAEKVSTQITAAGSVFVGPWSTESAGDYASGTNHTLPTSGWARSFSGVNIDAYMRKMTLQTLSQEGLQTLSSVITKMAQAEGLDAHARAVTIRTNK